ncbi:MAG: carbon monoxide dehydrogenase subunit G [Hyphomicrobiales bacterium]|uniref:SRPBCC family protein n=1 Tax=Nisaea sp. TaxID=2024842 RepID=UPI0032894A3A
MDMSGEYRISAPRETVWAALNDPDILKECIPGCDSLEKTSDTEMIASVTTKVGPVKAKFKGSVTLSDINPPESYKITGEGKGGAAGFAKGGADVSLTEDGAETLLNYTAKAQVGGKLAQLGSRLIDSTAKKMADEFFGNFSKKLSADSDAQTSSVPTSEEIAPNDDTDIGHGDNISDVTREIGEAVQDAEEALETEAGRGTLGGPTMWGIIALGAVIVLLMVFNMG